MSLVTNAHGPLQFVAITGMPQAMLERVGEQNGEGNAGEKTNETKNSVSGRGRGSKGEEGREREMEKGGDRR